VLFFQRIASRQSKVDRKSFKDDLLRVQDKVRKYMQDCKMVDQNADALVDVDTAKSTGTNLSATLVRDIGRKPPQVAYVSKHWYVRLTTMSQPGPLDNHMYLCPHKVLGCSSLEVAREPFVQISRGLWRELVQKFGGGPELNSLELCTKCQVHVAAYIARKRVESDLVTKFDTKDKGDGQYWYLLDAQWVNKWRLYTRAEPLTNIRSICHPGPITNSRLLDNNEVRQNLRIRSDYIGVNVNVWSLFRHIHGGGPCICRKELDIYSGVGEPEVRRPQDLFETEGEEVAIRTSSKFVDEFHGDRDAYNLKYGALRWGDDLESLPECKGVGNSENAVTENALPVSE